MQIFKAEAFDTLGKILPKATTIAMQISVIYLSITMLCIAAYFAVGMSAFDATVHAMTLVHPEISSKEDLKLLHCCNMRYIIWSIGAGAKDR